MDEEVHPEAEGDEQVTERQEKLVEDVDSILDEIDEVLEENAEEFVRSYVRKGGQGWSDFFTPEFYVAAATGGVLGGLAYDEFKAVVLRIVKSVRKARGEPEYDPFPEVAEHYEESIQNAWESASRLVKKQGIEHTIDQAVALHWTLFTKELERSAGTVRLGNKRHNRLARAASREDLSPSQLAARIIDQWLNVHELCSRRRAVRARVNDEGQQYHRSHRGHLPLASRVDLFLNSREDHPSLSPDRTTIVVTSGVRYGDSSRPDACSQGYYPLAGHQQRLSDKKS